MPKGCVCLTSTGNSMTWKMPGYAAGRPSKTRQIRLGIRAPMKEKS